MVRKCRRLAEITAVEMVQVSVKTRAPGLALAATAVAAAATDTATASSSRMAKKRKVTNEELDISTSHKIRRNRARTRRRVAITPENSVLPSPEVNSGLLSALEDRCSSRSLDHSSASCCSSNGSSERIEFADLKEESVEVETSMNCSCKEREETTLSSELQAESSEEMDSTARRSEVNSRRRSTAAEKMPMESQLEEFFSEAEKNLQKQFADKYNYDITKDEPLEGRYEWVRLKP